MAETKKEIYVSEYNKEPQDYSANFKTYLKNHEKNRAGLNKEEEICLNKLLAWEAQQKAGEQSEQNAEESEEAEDTSYNESDLDYEEMSAHGYVENVLSFPKKWLSQKDLNARNWIDSVGIINAKLDIVIKSKENKSEENEKSDSKVEKVSQNEIDQNQPERETQSNAPVTSNRLRSSTVQNEQQNEVVGEQLGN